MTLYQRLWRACGFAILVVVSQVVAAAWAFWQGSTWANWIVGGVAAFFAACLAPWLAGVIARRSLGMPNRPAAGVVWVSAAFALAFLLGIMIGLLSAPDAWGGLAVYAGMGGAFASAIAFALLEPRME